MTKLLEESIEAVKNRGMDYGHPYENFQRIAQLWSLILGTSRPIKIWEVGLMMDAVKTSRIIESPDHYDSWVDKAGYAQASWLATEREREIEERARSEFEKNFRHESDIKENIKPFIHSGLWPVGEEETKIVEEIKDED